MMKLCRYDKNSGEYITGKLRWEIRPTKPKSFWEKIFNPPYYDRFEFVPDRVRFPSDELIPIGEPLYLERNDYSGGRCTNQKLRLLSGSLNDINSGKLEEVLNEICKEEYPNINPQEEYLLIVSNYHFGKVLCFSMDITIQPLKIKKGAPPK